jgi:predicted transposase/invertase (TIGR01784 family)
MADPHVYKHGYALLFSNPVFVRELLESFVDKDFAATIDFSDFTVENEKHYLSKDMRDYAEDLVIKVKHQGNEAYIYLLIEFQSSVDKFMALRLLNYLTLFYLDYIKGQKLQGKAIDLLPPVFPLVLYNGNKPWTASTNMRALIEPHDFLGQFYPDFTYRLIAELDYSEESLLAISNTVSALFLLENTAQQRYDQLVPKLEQLVAHEDAKTIALFAIYLEHLVKNQKITPKIYEKIKNISNQKEAKSMLVHTIEAIRAEGIEKGREEGIEKGIEKGREEGIEKGIEQRTIEMVVAMNQHGIAIDTIARCAGISLAKVQEILARPQA